MFVRTFLDRAAKVLTGTLVSLSCLFGMMTIASAATCSCTCRGAAAVSLPVSACTSCAPSCEARCGAGGTSPTAVSCTDDTPSAPSGGAPGGAPGGTAGGGTGGSAGATPSGDAQTGICLYNCTVPRATTCTSNADCVTACNTNCPTLVGNSTCARSPAPRCAPAGADGTRTCIFECQVAPPDTCTIGDAGNSACGSRSPQICRPPSGGSGTAPTIAVSTTVQPRCASTQSPPSSSGDSNTNRSSSGSSGGSESGAFRLNNPITGANTIPAVIGKAVRAIMGLVGAIALLMFVIGGVRWILSAGDPKDVQAASDMLKNASIGLLIIFLSYTIITVGMGLVNDLSNQGDAPVSNATNNSASAGTGGASGASTNATNRAPTPPTPGSVAACNASYPARPFMRGDCAGCQASCLNILCRVNAPDASTDTAPPPADPRNRSTTYTFPAGTATATTECLRRCRASADCPAP